MTTERSGPGPLAWLLPLAVAAGAAPLLAGRRHAVASDRRDDERYPGLGSRVEVGDLTLHARVLGREHRQGPTVVFESGMSTPLELWAWIQPLVAEVARTVSYDRAGGGWSGPRRAPHSAQQVATDLTDLLAVLGCPGPYVLVGHSYGGLLQRRFAHLHPESVVGMVFVDAAHPDQFERSSRQRLGLSPTLGIAKQRALLASYGLSRQRSAEETAPIADGLPEAEAAAARARMRSAHAWRGTAAEMTAWTDRVNPEIRETGIPDGCRLAVVTSGRSVEADPVHGLLQDELAKLVPGGRHETLPAAGHLDLLTDRDHAEVVATIIREMVLELRDQNHNQDRDQPVTQRGE